MKAISILILIFLFIGCQTVQPVLDKPKEYKEVIQDTQKEIEKVQSHPAVKANPELQRKVSGLQNQIYKLSISLKESEQYGKDSYKKFIEQSEIVKSATSLNTILQEENKRLKEDFFSPTQRRYFVYTIICMILIAILYIGLLVWFRSLKIGAGAI